jgi:hypothetical protein
MQPDGRRSWSAIEAKSDGPSCCRLGATCVGYEKDGSAGIAIVAAEQQSAGVDGIWHRLSGDRCFMFGLDELF